nr:DUF4175 family protein [Govania unica]
MLPVVGVVLGYIALSLLDLWSQVPPLVHLLLFICLVVVVVGGVIAAIEAWRRNRESDHVHWGRYLLLLPVLIIALFLAGTDWERRLVMAFQPGQLFPPPQMQITAVITPPAYTHLEPLRLPISNSRSAAPLKVPAGSVLRVEVQETRWPPLLAWGKNTVVLRPEANGGYAIEGELKADGKVRLTYAGKTLVRWQVDVVPDKAPTLRFTAPPGVTARHSLRLSIDAEDDHGIEFLALKLKRADGSGVDHLVELPAWGTPVIKETIYRDLTADSLAGQEVILQLVALDGLSQEAVTPPVTMTLPKRQFHNPLSLSLVAIRAGLLTGEDDDVAQAVRRLRLLSEQPLVTSDATVHLGLRSAYLRLKSSYSEEDREEVANLMWDLALRAEDGGRSMTENDLIDALDACLTLVRRQADPEQVQGALGSLAEAFSSYGRARVTGAGKMGKDADAIDWEALRRLFLRLNDLTMAGDYDALAGQLVSLRAGLEEQPALLSANAYRYFVVASYARRVIDEVERQQEHVAARSRDNSAQPMVLAADQTALRNALGDLITQLARAGMPDTNLFHKLQGDMDRAITAFTNGTPEAIADTQTQVAQSLKAAMASLDAFPSPLAPDAEGKYHDPLGRPLPPGLDIVKGRD